MSALPEKAIQFGTGAFLRGFIGYFIERANQQGLFNGRIVAVESTGGGRADALNAQGGRYTLITQGIEQGVPVERRETISALSRALSAATQWNEVLAVARNPGLEFVFSNTTEVGITFDEGDHPELVPPRSFPGKLTAFLYERAQYFEYALDRGVTVLPCELIDDNGERLESIVLQLARRWKLGERFERWMHECVPFYNTLVDRIVPGKPMQDPKLGYTDELVTVCEPYRLFAIEADRPIGFAAADPGIIITDNVTPYRERKVRLLNGSHTIMVPIALLAGCETVASAVSHDLVGAYLRHTLFNELVPSVSAEGAETFAQEVLERFANPFIQHALADITLQQTMKMRVRVVPSILQYAAQFERAPRSVAFGFAAFLLSQRTGDQRPDEQGQPLRQLWRAANPHDAGAVQRLVRDALSRQSLWGTDLTRVPGFQAAVEESLIALLDRGAQNALEAHLSSAVSA